MYRGTGKTLGDRVSTHRGIAIKVFGTEGEQLTASVSNVQEFVLASGPTLPPGTELPTENVFHFGTRQSLHGPDPTHTALCSSAEEQIVVANLGRVLRKFVVPGSTDEVVLFSWGACTERVIRNVARIDRDGEIIWQANLPSPAAKDCFVGLAQEGELFVARTFSEWAVHLNADGRVLRCGREPITGPQGQRILQS